MDSFRLSYFLNTRRKSGIAFFMTTNRIRESGGITATKIQASDPPITNAMTTEKTSMTGQRNAMRTIII